MFEIKGIYNTAIVYTDELDEKAIEQIRLVCEQVEFSGCKIRIMPDAHAGMGCTIGTTMTILDKIVPGMVGVDIGCGIETVEITERRIDYDKLDTMIRHHIPSGRRIRKNYHPLNNEINLSSLRCRDKVNIERARLSIGTLGGGNHFIEIGKADSGRLFLAIHSGSRHIGTEVASYYQNEAYKELCGNSSEQIDKTIAQLIAEGRHKEIQPLIKNMKTSEPCKPSIPKDLAYVTGRLFDDYIHDMKIIQRFALLNRQAITEVILREMKLSKENEFTTIHNYIDTDSMILRKGAVSAKQGELLLIPINMRDGSLICTGKGNIDWNFSAPHGAGRVMSRAKAFTSLSMDEYKKQMEGIFTTSVNKETLDESPMAYKSMDAIVSHIAPTADILMQIKPVYNFKAKE